MPPKQKSSAVQVNKNDKQLAPKVTKMEVKNKPKAGHEELESLSPFLQLTYNKLIQIHDSGAATSKPQKDALVLEHQIDSELTWIAEQIRSFRQEQLEISGIKDILQNCKVSIPHEEAKKQQSSGSMAKNPGKLSTEKKTKDKDDVTVIHTEIKRIMDEVETLQAGVKSYRQTSGSILEIKELLKDRLKSEGEVSKGSKPKQSMQTDSKTKSIDLTVDDNIKEIKTEISQIINELSILEKDMQALLSLAQKGDLESKTEKGKNNKKETQLQGKVTAHQAFEKIQTILHGQMKKTGSATNKRQALDAVNEKQAKKENDFAQCPIQDAYWSSEKEKKLLSLQEQNKSHEDSLITLLNDKRNMAEENSELKRKLEASERNFLKKSKEADNLICEKQTFEENCRKRLDQETRHRLAQMQKEMQERDFTSYK